MSKCDFNKVAKLLYNFIDIAVRYGCPPVNLLLIFSTLFYKSTYVGMLLTEVTSKLDSLHWVAY